MRLSCKPSVMLLVAWNSMDDKIKVNEKRNQRNIEVYIVCLSFLLLCNSDLKVFAKVIKVSSEL